MRGRNILQTIKAVELLSRTDGTTINQMSTALEIDRRNVYRLLDIIQAMGFPVYDDDAKLGREKSWKLDAGYVLKLPNITLPDVRLNLSEILALYFLKAEASIYAGTEIENRTNAAFSKLSQFVPRNFQDQIGKLKTLFISAQKLTKDYSGKEEIIDSLAEAMLKNRTCLISYFSFMDDKTKKFRIDPLHFFERYGGLYLFVRVTRFDDIRMLAVERIESLEEIDESFEYPKDFDPEARLSSAFDLIYDGPIELEVVFSKDQAKYIRERQFSPGQEIIDNPDGSITLKMNTSGWFDVKKWILGFGSDALVVKPEEMREEIVEEMKNGLELYGND